MILIILVILLVTLLIVLFSTIKYNKEGFILNKKNISYIDDELFSDVLLFNNSDTELGIIQCMKSNCGYCVEYGVTGNALCFPKYRQIINENITIDNKN